MSRLAAAPEQQTGCAAVARRWRPSPAGIRRRSRRPNLFGALGLGMLLGSVVAGADEGPRPPGFPQAEGFVPPAVAAVKVVERLGQPVPPGLTFTDSNGRPFRLGDAFSRGKPVLLTLVYYQCPLLCSLVLSGTVTALNRAGLKLGEDYLAVTASIDPSETTTMAAERKRGHLQALAAKGDDAAWTFLTGRSEEIRALAESVGFYYRYDEETRQFAHAAVVFVLTPEGKLSRYLYGMQFEPRDLKLALLEAAGGPGG